MFPEMVEKVAAPMSGRIGLLVSGAHGKPDHALTQALRRAGVDVLPESADKAGSDQKAALADFHRNLLMSAGIAELSDEVVGDAWYASPKRAEFGDRAMSLLDRLVGQSYLFALDDPDMFRLLPFWKAVLESRGIRSAVVNFVDGPDAIFPCGGGDYDHAAMGAETLWVGRVLAAEQASRGLVRAHVTAQGLLDDADLVLQRMQQDIGLTWPAWSPKACAALRMDFVQRADGAFGQASSVALSDTVVAEWGRILRQVLAQWGRDGECPAGVARFDEIAHDFAAIEGVAGALFSMVGELAARLRFHEQRVDAATCRPGAAGGEQGADMDQRATIEARWAKIMQAGRHREEMLAEQNEVFRRGVEGLSREIEVLEGRLEQSAADLDKLRVSEISKQAEVERLSAQTKDLRSALAEAKDAIDKAKAQEAARMAKVELQLQQAAEEIARAQSVRQPELARRSSSHFFAKLAKAVTPPSLRKAQRQRQLREMVRQSGLFDSEFYAARYPDVVAAGHDLLDHYIRYGGAEGRHPGPGFNSRWYLNEYPDVRATGVNPLIHFLEHGRDEGRRRRTLADSGKGSDAVTVTSPGGTAKSSPPTIPHDQLSQAQSSDFKLKWPVKAGGWASLLGAERNDITEVATRSDAGGTGMNRAVTISKHTVGHSGGTVPSTAMDRLALFCSMRDVDGRALSIDGVPVAISPAHALLAASGLGVGDFSDAWFADQRTINFRLNGKGASIARLFQCSDRGDLACIGEVRLAGGDTDVIQGALRDPLAEVLVVLCAQDGAILQSMFLPFPSLLRGGLHHGEYAVQERAPGGMVGLDKYMQSVALEWFGWSSGPKSATITRVDVDLRGANGTEPLFRADILASLARNFGIGVKPLEGSLAPQHGPLTLVFEGHVPRELGNRSADGATLILPCDCLPSIYALVSRRMAHDPAITRFAVVDAALQKVWADVVVPGALPERRDFQHRDLPAHWPVMTFGSDAGSGNGAPLSSGGGIPVVPLAVRHRNAQAWQVDALMPISPDQPQAASIDLQGLSGKPLVTVVIDSTDDDLALVACLAAIEHQLLSASIEVVVAGRDPAASLPAAVLAASMNIRAIDGRMLTRAARLNEAAASAVAPYLLFIDPCVIMADPRALSQLLQIAMQPGTATTACALVVDREEDGEAHTVHGTGYFPTRVSLASEPAFNLAQVDVLNAFPAAAYPVVANQLKCCVIARAAWEALGGFDAALFPYTAFDLDFGSRAVVAGYANYCTSLVRASCDQIDGATDFPDSLAQVGASPAMWQDMVDRVAFVRELHR